MGAPGYVYLVGRETKDGAWAKVGIAARIGRVYDHERQGWTMLVRTFERDLVLEDPRAVERSVLDHFPDVGPLSRECGVCGAPKPLVGRTGSDGLTEVRHLRCHAGLPTLFAETWKRAGRLKRDAAWLVDFDPLSLRPGGFVAIPDPWRQPPRMDSNEYQANTCNVLCVRSVRAAEVVAFLDNEWETGTVDLRKALALQFGDRVCKTDGTPTPNAKGSGARGQRSDVEHKLAKMTRFGDVEIVMASVRKPGMLYAYVREGTMPAAASSRLHAAKSKARHPGRGA